MAALHRVGSIDIADDQRFTRKSWRWERAGWGLLAAVVAGALAGALGPGPLSTAAAGDGPLRIEYERFGRLRTESALRIRVRPSGDRAEIWLDRSYVEGVKIERVLPEPVRVIAEADRLRYLLPATEAVFELRFPRPGRLKGKAGLAGGETVEFGQFVYP